MRTAIHLLLILTLLTSCSVKKRNYRKGYHIDWAFHQNKKSEIPLKKHHAVPPQKNAQLILPEQETVLSAATEKSLSRQELKKPVVPDLRKDIRCDTLFFSNGKVAVGKILEILQNEIKYKRCDYPEGPTITISKSDVAKVIYANGVTESFEKKNKVTGYEYSSPATGPFIPYKKEIHPMAWAVFICTVSVFLTSIIGPIIAVIIAPTALKKIRAQPDKYEGEEMVKICRTISIVFLILATILICLFLVLLSMM